MLATGRLRITGSGFIGIWGIAGFVIWAIIFGFLAIRPVLELDRATGLYKREGTDRSFQWTGSRVSIPIASGSGPTLLVMTIGVVPLPGHAAPQLQLAAAHQELASFQQSDPLRRYQLVLGPDVTELRFHSTVVQPPFDQRRWIGVQLFDASARANGFPFHMLLPAAGIAGVMLGIAGLLFWSIRHGYGSIVALTLLGLAARVVWLGVAPPGFGRDEMISLVDAWFLARSGRDHLGNWLPLGAFEAYGDWISPLLTYLEVPMVWLVGPQPLVARIITALAGTLAIPAIYGLLRALQMPFIGAITAALVLAISPWAIFLSRSAKPPALVPLAWILCMWAGILLVRRGDRRAAIGLALAAGISLYTYPTLKMAIPLLVGLIVTLALWQHGWRAAKSWLGAGGLLALLWLPFVQVTLFNSASNTRLRQVGLQTNAAESWLEHWWAGYSVYFKPAFYYVVADDSPIRSVPGYGAQLLAEAPLIVLGIVALLLALLGRNPLKEPQTPEQPAVWWLILGALLIAPLPASLTETGAAGHTFRGASVVPLYALLAGCGAALLWNSLKGRGQAGRVALVACAIGFLAGAGYQSSAWFTTLVRDYPSKVAGTLRFADGLPEIMAIAVARAPEYDEIWLDGEQIGQAYIYLLHANPMPVDQIHRQIHVIRTPGEGNAIVSIGRYRFDHEVDHFPRDLPVIEAIPNQFGALTVVLQEWHQDGRNMLIVRNIGDR